MELRLRHEVCIAAALFGVAIFFATFHLTESPPVWMDEGIFAQAAANLSAYGQIGLRVAPESIEPSSKLITVGYPLTYPLAGWFKLFGVSTLAARSLMALFILGFLAVSYLFVRRLFGPALALGSLALLATLPTLYGNGKSVLGEVPGLMYLALFLLCLTIALSRTVKKYRWFILAGVFAGLAVATKPTFLVLLPAVAVGVFIGWRRGIVDLTEIAVAVAAGAVPLLVWLTVQFQAGDSLTSIMSYYVNPYQIPNLAEVILENIRRLFTGLSPLYLLGVMGVWVAAFGIRLRKREAIPIEEIIALVFSLLIIAAYTRTAGWYRYLFEAQALSLLFFPNALLIVARTAIRWVSPQRVAVASVVALTVLGAYQVMFSSFVAESYDRTKTAFLEAHFAAAPATTTFFIYNAPEVAIFMPNDNYYQYMEPAGGSIGKDQLPVLSAGGVDEVIVGTEAYQRMAKDLFARYSVAQTTHDYTILKKASSPL